MSTVKALGHEKRTGEYKKEKTSCGMMNPVGDFLQIARICNESSLPEYRVLWYYECAKDRVPRDLMENRLTLRA